MRDVATMIVNSRFRYHVSNPSYLITTPVLLISPLGVAKRTAGVIVILGMAVWREMTI